MSEIIEAEIVQADDTRALARSVALPADQNPAAVYLAGLSVGSRRTMRGALNKISELLTNGRQDAATLNWSAIRFQHVAAIRSALMDDYAPATVNKHLSAIRGVLKAAYRLGQMSGDDYRHAVDVDSVEGSVEPAGRMLSEREVDALLAACANDPGPAGTRDAAMVALWAVAGPRRAEVVALDVCDYNSETGAVSIRGKRHRERTVYIDNGAKRAMDDWLAIRGRIDGPLFVPVHQTGRMRVSRMTAQAVYSILNKRASEAGIADVSPHDLRRTAISNLIDATDLSTAQKIAGHADPKTTARYDRRGERAKRAAAAKMSVGYYGQR